MKTRLEPYIARLRHPELLRPLGRGCDERVDADLANLGLTRADLFTPAHAMARHRVRLAGMLNAHGVDIAHAIEDNWQDFKVADDCCAKCPSTRHCQRWLQWDHSPPRSNDPAAAYVRWLDLSKAFCPNAELFAAIAAEQASKVRRNWPHR